MKSVVRSFVAVEIAPEVRAAIEKMTRRFAQLPSSADNGVGVRWTRPDQFHLTLKFLGDIPITECHHVIRAVESACCGVEPFDLLFEGLGAFPSAEAPRTLWVAAAEGVDESRFLSKKIDDELVRLGYPREVRAFTPHLTVGRISDRRNARQPWSDFIAQERETLFGVSQVDAVVVYSSELSRSGPKYEPLAEIELKG